MGRNFLLISICYSLFRAAGLERKTALIHTIESITYMFIPNKLKCECTHKGFRKSKSPEGLCTPKPKQRREFGLKCTGISYGCC